MAEAHSVVLQCYLLHCWQLNASLASRDIACANNARVPYTCAKKEMHKFLAFILLFCNTGDIVYGIHKKFPNKCLAVVELVE